MEEITVSAKTLDDAITEALIQLGVTSDQLEYDVIEKWKADSLVLEESRQLSKQDEKLKRK